MIFIQYPIVRDSAASPMAKEMGTGNDRTESDFNACLTVSLKVSKAGDLDFYISVEKEIEALRGELASNEANHQERWTALLENNPTGGILL